MREVQHSLTMVSGYTATAAATRRFFVCLLLVPVLTAESVFVSSRQGLSTLTPTRGRGRESFSSSQQRLAEQEDFRQIRKEVNRDFLSIAAPAFLQQAAVPFADLVDSTFVAQLEPEALGGVGVARASQAAVSKLYTSPLSKTTISLIASKYGASRKGESKQSQEELSSAVSTGLLLALIVGLLQWIVFTLFAAPILAGMGISRNSDMAPTAVAYMKTRAFAAPAATIWLATNGIFRGFGDTTTPFKCSVLLNVINYLLDPIFIFTFGLGASGVAAATAVSQYAALVPLLWILQSRVRLKFRGHWRELSESMRQYGKAGFYLIIRTLARIAAFTYCSRQAARLGSVGASAYSITFQIGFFITLVYESISVAVQTLLSRELADVSRSPSVRRQIATHLVRTSLLSGTGMALLLTSMVYTGRFRIVQVFSTSPEVQEATLLALPAFLITQFVKSVSFPVNGVIMGEMDWRFSMLISWLANAVCFATLRIPSGPTTVGRIWTAWSAFFGTQAVCGLLRYIKKAAEWKKLTSDDGL